MLRQRLSEALKGAMKAKDDTAVSTLRLILAALKDRDIAARGRGNTEGIPDDEILGLLQTMIRQRRDSIELYDRGGRPELAARERAEIAVIERFLPAQLDAAATRAAVERVIADIGATSLKDMGRIMAELRARHAGQMDFTQASAIVRAALS